MKQRRRISWGWLGRKLRGQFLLGIFVLVPVVVTILILVGLFNYIDNILQPVVQLIWHHPVPGIGFGVMVVLIYLIGVIASNIVGKTLIRYGESLVARVPLVRPLYSGIKDVLESFSAPSKGGFLQTVLVEFPRKGIWSIGFITKESTTPSGETQLNILVPTTPNPTTGFLQIAKEDEVIRTNIPVNEAFKIIVSAGKISPQEITDRLSERTK